jgi:SNF2 family DNA or RNA helicase
MTALVFGELTADRSRIILLADGPAHEVAPLAARLEALPPLFKPTDPPGAVSCPATWPAVVQLSATFGAAWRPGPALTAWITEQLLVRTDQGGDLVVPPPPGRTPRIYQVAGARMIGLVGSAMLFDDQGTGKTVTTVLGLVERHAAGHPVLPAVVVCPNAVQDSWVEHVRDWAPRWRAVAWRGSPARRRRLMGTADVYVVSYGTARSDAGETSEKASPLLALRPATVVADEVHRLKGQATEQSRAVRRLAAKATAAGGGFVGLSGTPITHHPGDLWPALHCMAPGAWPSRERYVGRYCLTVAGDYAAKVLGLDERTEPEFRTCLLGQYRRVSKADVLTELPPKVYSVRRVEIPPRWRKVYDDMEGDMLAELPDGGELAVMSVLAQMTRLAQLASAAADVETTTETVEVDGLQIERPHVKVTLKAPSWKVDELLEVMAERPGKQVIAAAPSRQLMMLAGAAAVARGYRVGYVVGGQSARERTAQIDAFQRGELDLICVTTQAGGVGITLTAASTVVFLQRPWSLVDSLQMEDRAHRIGSERHDSIEIIDVVAINTIEARVRSVLRERAGALADLVQDPRIVAELLGGAGVRDLRKAS